MLGSCSAGDASRSLMKVMPTSSWYAPFTR